jgi:dephospho-CoA kinase
MLRLRRSGELILVRRGELFGIDADKVAHSVYEPGNAARSDLVDAFGRSIVNDDDNSINRPALGLIVFSDPSKLKRLENIVWPHTQRMVDGMLRSVPPDASKRPIVIVEAAMLLDADWCQWMDGVWMVTADPGVCRRRIVDRGGTEEQAIQRIQVQSTRRGIQNLQAEVEKGVVSAVITNNGSIEDLKELLLSKLDDASAWYQREQYR